MKSILVSSDQRQQAAIAAMFEIDDDLLDAVSGGGGVRCKECANISIHIEDGTTTTKVDCVEC